MNDFENEIRAIINKYSKENDSDTPDFILAKYLSGCLDLFSNTIKSRDKWYNFEPFDDYTIGNEVTNV
jgi:hypothetical protein